MRTKGMQHQCSALQCMEGRRAYALFMEQGTGKTWTMLADAERLYAQGAIDGVLVIAPNGVHTNWVNREIPTHMEGNVIARAWRSGAGVAYTKHLNELFAPRPEGQPVPLRILSVNVDALTTSKGYDFCRKFLNATRAMLIVDESSRIKNPDAARTKALMRLRMHAHYARIASGTPVTNSPVDMFAQMEFLETGLLGTTSYRAFVSEYADLVPSTHPMMQNMIRRNPKMAFAQVVARNEDGTPRWRNLEKLQRLIAPHSFRVLKKDCLDLPEKIYKTITFELDADQRRAYSKMRDELRIDLGDQTELPVSELAALVKLQQITSGYLNLPGGEVQYVSEGNPRLKALLNILEDIEGKFIIWARFREELSAISAALAECDVPAVEYHGGINREDRERAVNSFQEGTARAFVGQPQSGGIGLTLTAAETVIYYSNDFNLETRLQSEDRAHRIGTKRNVVYIDLAAEDTIDETISRNLQRKQKVAAKVLGDSPT